MLWLAISPKHIVASNWQVPLSAKKRQVYTINYFRPPMFTITTTPTSMIIAKYQLVNNARKTSLQSEDSQFQFY